MYFLDFVQGPTNPLGLPINPIVIGIIVGIIAAVVIVTAILLKKKGK